MILKKKIARNKQLRLQKYLDMNGQPSQSSKTSLPAQPSLSSPKKQLSSETKAGLSLRLKNVSKNYGRAICNFILTDISKPYLEDAKRRLDFELAEFYNYIKEKRSTINGIKELRSMLLVDHRDSDKVKTFKLAFQEISEVFIKYFAINWIFNSKLEYKLDYAKCRHKILRRVRNPQLFTYLHY